MASQVCADGAGEAAQQNFISNRHLWTPSLRSLLLSFLVKLDGWPLLFHLNNHICFPHLPIPSTDWDWICQNFPVFILFLSRWILLWTNWINKTISNLISWEGQEENIRQSDTETYGVGRLGRAQFFQDPRNLVKVMGNKLVSPREVGCREVAFQLGHSHSGTEPPRPWAERGGTTPGNTGIRCGKGKKIRSNHKMT